MAIEALRTPDARFVDYPGYAFAPRYVEDLPGYEGLRAHYLDLGPADAEHTFLCLHGEPSWCYLYRKMIPPFLESGARVIAPDLYGFGRSDKPINLATYTYEFHRNFLLRIVERLDPRNITLVVQDWGGILGLTLPVDRGFRARLSRLIVMNTTIATGRPAGPGFEAWRQYALDTPDMPVGALFQRSDPQITPEEAAAYDAPFPDARYKAGVRAFPQLVMTEPNMPGVEVSKEAERFWRDEWFGPSFMAVGEADPVLGPAAMEALRRKIRGCPEPMRITDGGHFVQERGEPIARAALAAFRA